MGPTGSGKTVFNLGLAQKLLERGLKLSYFKPVGAPLMEGAEDADAVLMRSVLGLEYPPSELMCIQGSPHYLSRYHADESHLARIKQCFDQITRGCDLALVGGAPLPFSMAGIGLDSLTLARELGSAVVIVMKVVDDYSADRAILYNEYATAKGLEVIGTVLNHVPRPLLDKASGVYRPLLESKGFPVLGVVPKRPEISFPTVKEYFDLLGGEILTGEDRLHRLVEDVVVGAMTLESALTYLRRAPNKAVITGGDRADLALAALETDTSALILTGGYYPDVKVVARAGELGVPVLLVSHDTYTTIEKVHDITRKIKPGDQEGIRAAKEAVENHCDWQAVLRHLRGR